MNDIIKVRLRMYEIGVDIIGIGNNTIILSYIRLHFHEKSK